MSQVYKSSTTFALHAGHCASRNLLLVLVSLKLSIPVKNRRSRPRLSHKSIQQICEVSVALALLYRGSNSGVFVFHTRKPSRRHNAREATLSHYAFCLMYLSKSRNGLFDRRKIAIVYNLIKFYCYCGKCLQLFKWAVRAVMPCSSIEPWPKI